MALAYRTSAVGGNTTTGTSPTATITPVVDDLFVVFCQAGTNTNSTPTCSDNNGGSYTRLFAEGSNSNASYLSCFIRTALLPNTTSTVVTVACGAHAAVEMCVVALSNAGSAGSLTITQSGAIANQSASTTPVIPSFSNSVPYGDIILSAIGCANGSGTPTAPTSTSFTWTKAQDVYTGNAELSVAYTTGANGLLPSSSVTWGSTVSTVYAGVAIEITSTPPNAGINASKLVSYGVVAPPIGVDASKLVSYGILAPPVGVVCSKLVAYAVLSATNTNPPVWPVISPPAGYVGNPYLLQWDLTTAASPTTFTLFSGSLPPGLSLSNVVGGDGNQGKISGTPTTVGSYSFVITATNAYGTANEPMTIVISLAMGVNSAFVFLG